MLAMKSYEQTNGFSVFSTDELYFINGGSGNTNKEPTTGQKVGYVIARVGAEVVCAGNSSEYKDAWAKGVSGMSVSAPTGGPSYSSSSAK